MKRKAVFLDQDGTVIRGIANRPGAQFEGKVTAPFTMEELKFEPRLGEAMELLRDADFLRIIITNKPNVAAGHLSSGMWSKIHKEVMSRVDPDDYWMCTHPRWENCPWTKPSPLMIQAAAHKWDVDLEQSFMIGDTHYDVGAGKAASCKTILLSRPYNGNISILPDYIMPDLVSAAHMIAAKMH